MAIAEKPPNINAQLTHHSYTDAPENFGRLTTIAADKAAIAPTHKAKCSLVTMSSTQGKELFTQALAEGGLESYFPLSEQYLTQTDPALTAVSSLAMVLNALNHDPQRTWKGPWRWNSEEVVQCIGACGHSLASIRRNGATLAELAAMARCKGVRARPVAAAAPANAGPDGLARFRRDVADLCGDPAARRHAVVQFSRAALGQPDPADAAPSGGGSSGHFSPLGGYHAARDMVLVLDVSRHRSPPFWVPLPDLWAAMQAVGAPGHGGGGYVILSSLATPAAPAPLAQQPAQWAWPGGEPAMCPLMIRSWSEHEAGGHCCKPGAGGDHAPRRAGRRRAPRRAAPAPAPARGAATPAAGRARDGEALAGLMASGRAGARPLHTSRPCLA
jgi:glutathione gamma-glutamylcysteinyltransferase